jgi:hypothetical protein
MDCDIRRYLDLCKLYFKYDCLEVITTYEEYLEILTDYDFNEEIPLKIRLKCGCIMTLSFLNLKIFKTYKCSCTKSHKIARYN